MAETITGIVQHRVETAAVFTSTNPVLLEGEFAFESDTKKIKVGNGSTAWTSLSYINLGTVDGNLTVTGSATIDTHLLQNSSDRPGLLEITGPGSTWKGIQIKSTTSSLWSLMGDQDDIGLYDDVNSEWIFAYDENAGFRTYYNGAQKTNTTSTGLNVTGSIYDDGVDIKTWTDSVMQDLLDAFHSAGWNPPSALNNVTGNVITGKQL